MPGLVLIEHGGGFVVLGCELSQSVSLETHFSLYLRSVPAYSDRMFDRKLGEVHDAVHITKPTGASLRHAFDALREFRFPRPEGFSAGPRATDLSLFVLEPTDAFGPIGYSTDTRRLYFYKAVFADGAMALMTIAGESLSFVLKDNSLQNALFAIRAEAHSRGGIEHHAVCSIKTPLSKRAFVDFIHHHKSQVILQSAIQDELAAEAGGLNQLQLKSVELDGWSPHSSSVPNCVLEREHEGSTSLRMKFVWARGERHSSETLL